MFRLNSYFMIMLQLYIQIVTSQQGCSNSGIYELITNGDFSTPRVTNGSSAVFQGGIPGWRSFSSDNRFQLWKQGFGGFPSLNQLGQGTGQHCQILSCGESGYIATDFTSPTCAGQSIPGTLSFHFMQQPGTLVQHFGFALMKNGVEVVYTENLSTQLTTTQWTYYQQIVSLDNNAYYSLIFNQTSEASGGVHIDAVSFSLTQNICSSTSKTKIINGDFAAPVVPSDRRNFKIFFSGIDGWTTFKENGFEIWKNETKKFPPLDYFGNPTGQHLEISGNVRNGNVSTSFSTPNCSSCSSEVQISFQFMRRPDHEVEVFGILITDATGRNLFADDLTSQVSPTTWYYYSLQLSLRNNARYQLTFLERNQYKAGVHINDVQVNVINSCSMC
eukprot:TRINITY_DN227_c0_g1_i9.p1 TRINITY_DN227_c0_g1~~TRINITY_DN227_c0_g1_i9.p1  ORF type:complete len:388 (-),score=11.03 TRINITY_DN227_c0_g1_i9:382-1545(-)